MCCSDCEKIYCSYQIKKVIQSICDSYVCYGEACSLNWRLSIAWGYPLSNASIYSHPRHASKQRKQAWVCGGASTTVQHGELLEDDRFTVLVATVYRRKQQLWRNYCKNSISETVALSTLCLSREPQDGKSLSVLCLWTTTDFPTRQFYAFHISIKLVQSMIFLTRRQRWKCKQRLWCWQQYRCICAVRKLDSLPRMIQNGKCSIGTACHGSFQTISEWIPKYVSTWQNRSQGYTIDLHNQPSSFYQQPSSECT